jgi:O-antigen/teichoic acid export membrane protein
LSLRRNVLATYASHLYVAVVGIAVTPFYLADLGTEAYALVGFFAMLLAWFQLLDLGLSPAVMREVARFRGGAIEAGTLRSTVRAIELLFMIVAALAAGSTALIAAPIAEHWLEPRTLSTAAVAQAVLLMAIAIGLRFASIFYRAVIVGNERLQWIGGFNVTIASIRAFGVLPAMAWLGGTPRVFFTVQLVIGVVELGALALQAYRHLPAVEHAVGWSLAPLRGVARLTAAVGFTGGLTVVMTQSDRLVLSGLLSLTDYAHFNLAVLAASAVALAGAPLGTALQPRMAALVAAGDRAALLRVYAVGTRVMGLVTLPLAAVLAFHSEPLLWAWTGQAEAARAGAPVLSLYALGNAVMAHLGLPYALQFATGRLKLHVIGNALLVLTLVPGQVFLTIHYGAVGAGAFWLAVNLLYASFWIPVALHSLAPESLRGWYLDILRLAVVAGALAWLGTPLIVAAQGLGRAATTGALAVLGSAASLALVASHGGLRAEWRVLWTRARTTGKRL